MDCRSLIRRAPEVTFAVLFGAGSVNLLTRLLLMAEGQPRKNKLVTSDISIAKSAKAKKSS